MGWARTGALAGGRPVDHRGVTSIDLDGNLITGLRTYCDSAAFVLVPAPER